MKRFLFLLLLFPLAAFAQLSDSFENSDLSHNPPWTGTRTLFVVNAQQQLQLNDSIAGTAWLATPFKMLPQTEWRIWVKAAFSPSSQNFIRIFLAADSLPLSALTQGYFLQLGETGTDDAVALYRFSGDSSVLVCRGNNGEIAKPFVLRIKVLRDTLGNWEIWTDISGGENFKKEAEGTDAVYRQLNFFGLYCRYTRSNAKKMFFDDLYAGPPVKDTVPPAIDSLLVLNDSTLQLFFSESIDSVSAVMTNHYRLVPSGETLSAARLTDDKKSVILLFSGNFRNESIYSITVSGIKDLAGNRMPEKTMAFTFVIPHANDLVFNEIMADPTPTVGLPEYEYLELYNRDSVEIHLSGWQLRLGKSVKTFGKVTIPGRGYLILCKKEAAEAFSPFGKVYGFSSFSLTNGGERLQLFDKKEMLIASVQYDKSWYRDADKANGGWSLEQINPDNVCSGGDNWRASENPAGGTPGKENSVYSTKVLFPQITALQVPDRQSLKLEFSQKMDSLALTDSAFYAISPGNFTLSHTLVPTDRKGVTLEFSPGFDTSTLYHLTVSAGLSNCSGQPVGNDTVLRFGIPQEAEEKDVVINEVLFYPWEGGVDYVELYNRSHKTIDLSSLILGTVKKVPPNPPDSLFYDLSFDQKLFFPGDYLLLTSSPDKVKAQYQTKNPHAFLQVVPFPNLSKEAGSVLLYRQLHKIDAFDYSEKMQYPLLNYTQGVALERVRADGETNDAGNWHSASEEAGFGTPGYKNSQSIDINPDTLAGTVWLDPEIFSPDNDGYQDVLPVFYHFKTAGNTISIRIFDASGYPVRRLVNNRYVGTSGAFTWDGLQDDGTRAPAGIYILYIRVFDEQGHVKQFKKTAVLAVK